MREETSVGRNALSISYAGVRLAQPEHREVMEALTRSIVKKLLHNPTTFLKERADKRQLQAVRDLFRLWHDS